MTKFEDLTDKLEHLGWRRYMGDAFNWKFGDTGRFVDIDLPYIDIHIYKDGEKYGSYLSVIEFNLFNELLKCDELYMQHNENLVV